MIAFLSQAVGRLSLLFVVSIILVFSMAGAWAAGEFVALTCGGSVLFVIYIHSLSTAKRFNLYTKRPTIRKRLYALWCYLKVHKLQVLMIFAERGVQQCHPLYYSFANLVFFYLLFPLVILMYEPKMLSYKHLGWSIEMFLRSTGAIGCVALAMQAAWKPRFRQRYLPLIWQGMLVWCLPLLSTYELLMHFNGSMLSISVWLLNFGVALFLLASFVDSVSIMVLTVVGILSGAMLYTLRILLLGAPMPLVLEDATSGLMFVFYIIITVCAALSWRKAQEHEIVVMKMFGSTIAHESRGPLASVYTAAGILEDIYATPLEKDKDEQYYLIKMRTSDWEVIGEIIAGLKTISRGGLKTVNTLLTAISNHGVIGDEGVYSLKSCINTALELLELPISERERITVYAPKDIEFFGSIAMMQCVLENIIGNALKYGGAGVPIRITIEGRCLHIWDGGRGIRPDDLQHIFTPFYAPEHRSTGLGLNLCAGAIKQMKGTITCRSELGKYTEFIIELPARKSYQGQKNTS